MNLLILKNNFELDRINLRKSKSSIKLSYDITFLNMIGITIPIKYNNFKIKGSIIILKVHPEDKMILQNIDNYLLKRIPSYVSFIENDIISIRKHNNFNIDNYQDNQINITINIIKNINDKNIVQIFSI